MSSISLGVAALVAIDSFSDNVIRSVHEQSRALLGGDVMVDAQRAADQGGRLAARFAVEARASLTRRRRTSRRWRSCRAPAERASCKCTPSPTAYPYYGKIMTEPASAWSELQNGHNVIVDPALIVSLDAQIGDTLSLGNAKFVITGTLKSVPGDVGIQRGDRAARLHARAIRRARPGSSSFGSRARVRDFVQAAGDDRRRARSSSRFSKRMSDGDQRRDAERRLQRVAPRERDRSASRLSRASSDSSRCCSAASASRAACTRSSMRKIDPVAILRCLGATSWQVLAIYTAQAAVMGFIGALRRRRARHRDSVRDAVCAQGFPSGRRRSATRADGDSRSDSAIGVWVALALLAAAARRAASRVAAAGVASRAGRRRAPPRALGSASHRCCRSPSPRACSSSGSSRANTVQRGVGFTVAIGGGDRQSCG